MKKIILSAMLLMVLFFLALTGPRLNLFSDDIPIKEDSANITEGINNVHPSEPECDHDWFVIETGKIYKYNRAYVNGIGHGKEKYYIPINRFLGKPGENKVCTICGECVNGIEEFQKAYDKQEQAKIDRDIRAKKLWENRKK